MITRFVVPSCPLPSPKCPRGPPLAASRRAEEGRRAGQGPGKRSSRQSTPAPREDPPGHSPHLPEGLGPSLVDWEFQSGQRCFSLLFCFPTKGLAQCLLCRGQRRWGHLRGSPHPPCLLGVPALARSPASDVRHQSGPYRLSLVCIPLGPQPLRLVHPFLV